MTKLEGIARLNHLRNLGEKQDLIVSGWLKDHRNLHITGFAAGEIKMTPDPTSTDAEAADTDYRIVYSSRDKERSLDVTDLSDGDFVSFMKSQPAELYEIKPFE
jgi:hypothetical protein